MSQHDVYERENGHEWAKANDFITWDYCARCLKIRRADKRNPPCRGPSGLRPVEAPLTNCDPARR